MRRAAGAEIVPFSPLADEPPPPDCDACWLPGGYPELHAGAIAGARRFLDGLRAYLRRHGISRIEALTGTIDTSKKHQAWISS